MGSTVFERRPPHRSVVEHALADSRHAVFWLDDLGRRVEYPRLVGDTTADLVVVGGGYTGLWTALRALEREPSLRVVVVEAKTVGWAASGRNGGFCEASLTHGRENGERRWPDELEDLERLGVENLDGIEATVARYGLDCEFERTGYLSVAVEEHQVPWLAESDGHDGARFVGEEEIRSLVNSPTYLAGLIVPPRDSALVNPAKLATELARVVVELGGTIHERTMVRGLERSSDGVEVRTAGGTMRAQQVALGTNAFPSLLVRNRLMTVPVYDYVLMTEPLSGVQKADIGWNERQGIGDLANQFHYYRQSADDRILWGGYDAVYHAGGRIRPEYERRPESFERLASHFLTTFPQLEGIRFSHTWAGVIDTSTQFSAFFGAAFGGRVAYAAGFTGLGVGATRFAADVMLDLLSGEETERTRLEMVRKKPLPFPPEPAAAIGVNATRWSLDRADHNGGRRNVLLKTLDALGLGFDS
jgi:glycine/D-amino acid oxidase-like deaminating enzyme